MSSGYRRPEPLRDSEIFIEPKHKSGPGARVLSPKPLYGGRYFRPHTPELMASLTGAQAGAQPSHRYLPPRAGLGAPPEIPLEPVGRRRTHHSHRRIRRPGSPTVEEAAAFRAARAQPICPCCAQVNELSDQLAGRGPYERPDDETTHPPAAGGHAWYTGVDARIPDTNPSQHPLDLYTQPYLPLGGLVDFEQTHDYLRSAYFRWRDEVDALASGSDPRPREALLAQEIEGDEKLFEANMQKLERLVRRHPPPNRHRVHDAAQQANTLVLDYK